MPKTRYILWDGKETTVKEIAKILGLKLDTLRGTIYTYKCYTQETIIAARKKTEDNCVKRRPLKIINTIRGEMTLKGIWEVNPEDKRISWHNLRYRIHKYGEMSPIIFWEDMPITEFREKKALLSIEELPDENSTVETRYKNTLYFNRNKFCRREKFKYRCKHYNSCAMSRAVKSTHHDRYKNDGSCYVQELLPEMYVQKGGRSCKRYLSNGAIQS